jgi:hypothetical protein
MFRTFINSNGNIEYIPINSFSQNVSLQSVSINPYYQNIIPQPIYTNDRLPSDIREVFPDPYSNSSLIITTSEEENDFSFSAYPKPIFYNSTSYDVNNDPELRKKVVKYFFHVYSTNWLPFSFVKLQKYFNSSNGNISFIKNINEYNKESSVEQSVIPSDKLDFIIDNIFGKHELLVFLDKFVRVNNVNWYDLKSKHYDKVKTDLYDKLKNHIKKIVIKQL